eukprot:1137631-Pelagomonas_calceolata.AAC.4
MSSIASALGAMQLPCQQAVQAQLPSTASALGATQLPRQRPIKEASSTAFYRKHDGCCAAAMPAGALKSGSTLLVEVVCTIDAMERSFKV